MKKILPLFGAVLLVTATAVPATAQLIVTPTAATITTYVGQTASHNFLASNATPFILTVTDIEIVDDANGVFALSALPSLPTALGMFGFVSFSVAFTPSSAGTFTAQVRVTYSGGTGSPQYASLTGIGQTVTPPPPPPPPTYTPEELMYQLLVYYDDAISLGEIWGVGKGKSADNKAMALGNQLEAAAKKVYSGDYDDAVDKLFSILKKVDEAKSPKDFVAGPGLGQLQYRITELIAALGG